MRKEKARMYFYYRRCGDEVRIYVVKPNNSTECVGIFLLYRDGDFKRDEQFIKSIIKLYKNRVERKRR